MEFPEKITKFM